MAESNFQHQRWAKEASYSDSWGERNQMLVSLAEAAGVFDEVDSLVEYGCGPNAPLSSCARQRRPALRVSACDITRWNESTQVVDLNTADLEQMPPAGCASLSGVLEYIDQPSRLLRTMADRYAYLLLSYCPTDFSRSKGQSFYQPRPARFKAILGSRIASGFRTHYTSDRILECCAEFGYPVATDVWRDQLLLVLKGRQNTHQAGQR